MHSLFSATVANPLPRCLKFSGTLRGQTPPQLLKFFISLSKLSSLIFQLLKFIPHPLLKTLFILFLPLFRTVMVISSAMCNVDSWDLMSSCLAYVTPSNKLLCWIMYHMYISQVLPALWRLISALIVCHLNQDFCPCFVELPSLVLPAEIKSSAHPLFSAAYCSACQTLKMFWEKPTVMIFWRKKSRLLIYAHLSCNTWGAALGGVFACMWFMCM